MARFAAGASPLCNKFPLRRELPDSMPLELRGIDEICCVDCDVVWTIEAQAIRAVAPCRHFFPPESLRCRWGRRLRRLCHSQRRRRRNGDGRVGECWSSCRAGCCRRCWRRCWGKCEGRLRPAASSEDQCHNNRQEDRSTSVVHTAIINVSHPVSNLG